MIEKTEQGNDEEKYDDDDVLLDDLPLVVNWGKRDIKNNKANYQLIQTTKTQNKKANRRNKPAPNTCSRQFID
jgi:hypothetical protein